MIPAHQRFDANHPVRPQIDLRLKMQQQFLALQGFSQQGLDPQTL